MNSGRLLQDPETQGQSADGQATVADRETEDSQLEPTQRLAPTQRVSEVYFNLKSIQSNMLTVTDPGHV